MEAAAAGTRARTTIMLSASHPADTAVGKAVPVSYVRMIDHISSHALDRCSCTAAAMWDNDGCCDGNGSREDKGTDNSDVGSSVSCQHGRR